MRLLVIYGVETVDRHAQELRVEDYVFSCFNGVMYVRTGDRRQASAARVTRPARPSSC
jgi:hypothetical protein